MSEPQLKQDVREQTGYTDTKILSDSALDTAYRNAKRHLRVSAGVGADIDWFASDQPQREEALYWYTCLFAKVATGELDSQTVQVSAIDVETLLAKSDDEVTTWYRNAKSAERSLSASSEFRATTVARQDRTYGSDNSNSGSGGSGSGLGTNI